MVSDLEHRNSIVAIMARIEEHDIVVSTIFQFFFNELYQLVHNIAAGDTVAVHTCILVFLPDDLRDRVREMRIIYTIENAVNDQSLALIQFSLAIRHSAESNQLVREWVQALPPVKYQWTEQMPRRSEREVPSES